MMNIANKISMLRLVMALALITMFGLTVFGVLNEVHGWIAILILFTVGSFTDFLDGKIARSKNLVTTFGKFIDPISDKILVNSTLFLVATWIVTRFAHWNGFQWVMLFAAVMMLVRDIAVDASRMMCAKEGKVVHASIYGKIKTILQMVSLTVMLVGIVVFVNGECAGADIAWWSVIGLVGATIASLLSGIDYIKKSKDVLFKSM